MVVEDTGLGIGRTNKVVIVTLVTMPRGQELKLKFHNELCRELKKSCDIEASDVMVSMVTNSAPDWSFGNGTAQFVTGEL